MKKKQTKTRKRAIQNWKRLRNWKLKSAVQKMWSNMHVWNPNLFENFGLKAFASRTRIAGMMHQCLTLTMDTYSMFTDVSIVL